MATAQDLNKEFGIAGQLNFRDDASGLVIAEINNAHGSASLCLQGAHLMTWQPKGEAEPVIWMSRDAKLAPGKSIRGGVPVCWPWFGPHKSESSYPAHGFVRTLPWAVVASSSDEETGSTRLSLRPLTDAKSTAMLHAEWRLMLTVIVGETLRIELASTNNAAYDYTQTTGFVVQEALHSYLRVGDIGSVRVSGLDGCTYVDRVDGDTRKQQEGEVAFAGETDRIYLGTRAECVIEDDKLKRRIRITKTGSSATVLWTPWSEKAAKMGDLGQPDGWREMLCVEPANVLGEAVNIPSGGEHVMVAEYSVEAL